MKRIPSLDGLRAFSIALVILGHLAGIHGFPFQLNRFWYTYAHFGVVVFFVISGYLITTLLLKEQQRNGFISWRGFYRRRAIRIFPACFVYIAAVTIWFHPPWKYVGIASTYLMCYTGGWGPWQLGHLWSLSVEEQFYFFWPLALILCFSLRQSFALLAFFGATAIRLWLHLHSLDRFETSFPGQMDAIAAGCLLAMNYHRMPRRLLHPATTTAVILAAMLAPNLHGPLEQTVTAPLVAASIFILVERKDWILNNRLTAFVGALSYSLYLWQQPFLNRTSTAWYAQFPLNILLAFAAAYASYRIVELPLLSYRSVNHPTTRDCPAAANASVGC